MFYKLTLTLIAGIIALLAIIGIKTITAPDLQSKVEALSAPPLSDISVLHFQQAIQYKTISYDNTALWDSVPFAQFRNFLEMTYPLVHQHLQREIISNYSYLYKWEGKNTALKPYILMAHQDVVPIEEATKALWTYDPFSGTIKDEYIWGRGTTDDKINLISIMESAEKLLKENYQPERTIYFAFGHDEEISGKNGAKKIAETLAKRKIKAALVLDEGGFVTQEKVPGMKQPVALIGTAEKGYMTMHLSVTKSGGHSSMPEKETALDILLQAIIRLRTNPFEARYTESMQDFMQYLAPHISFPNNMAMANPTLFKKLIVKNYEKTGSGNAMMRTTAVPTIIHSGMKENVIPTVAEATINFRLLPGDSSKQIVQKVKDIINDNRVLITIDSENVNEGTKSAPAKGEAFQKIDSWVKRSYDNTLSAPFLLIGATDSRYFSAISDNIFKFSPMLDPIGFHGVDERVSLQSFKNSLWFFEQLLRSSN